MNNSILITAMMIGLCSMNRNNGPASCNSTQFAKHPKHQQYQKELEAFHKRDDAPGTLIAIKKKHSVLWIGTKGFSRMETNTEMTACTPFRTGSITKVFTAVLVLQLQEQGYLNITNTLAKLLPETIGKIPQAEKITVQQLLQHTSGITDPKNDDPEYIAQITKDPASIDSMPVGERLKLFVYGKPLHFVPGTGTHYANSGYWLLGLIVERITGKTMQQALLQMIFTPAQMEHSYFEKRANPHLSFGYTYLQGNRIEVSRWDAADGDADPSSGVISTAEDLIRFGFALFGGKLVSPTSLQQMLTISTTPDCAPQCSYGLGIESWDAGKFKGYGMNGTSVGVDANWIFYPEQNTCLVLFKNCGNGSHKDFMKRMIQY